MIHGSFQSWTPVFALIIAMDLVTGLLALFVLKPMRANWAGHR
jgi:hypothetical protein